MRVLHVVHNVDPAGQTDHLSTQQPNATGNKNIATAKRSWPASVRSSVRHIHTLCQRSWTHHNTTCSGTVVEYRIRNREVAGLTHTRSTAINLEQVANLLCDQANSASYPQRDGKWVVATATGWRPSVADWVDGVADWVDGVSASCTVDPIVR